MSIRTKDGAILKVSAQAEKLIEGLNSDDRTHIILHLEGCAKEEIASLLGESEEEANAHVETTIYKLLSAPINRALKEELKNLFLQNEFH